MSHPSAGRFVWIDLMTEDKQADLAFLGALVGWTSQDQDMGEMGTYTTLQNGEVGLGGIMELPADEGPPAHASGYCIVDDIEAACAKAKAAGATEMVPPTPIPDVGTFSILADPAGAVIAPMQAASGQDMSPEGPPKPGSFVWWELVTPDVEGAIDFYGQVIGWSASKIDMQGQDYWLWSREGDEMNPGGLMTPPGQYDGPAFWIYYVWVEDVDATTARVESLGGQVKLQPQDVPGQGRISAITTPGGVMLGLFTPGEQG